MRNLSNKKKMKGEKEKHLDREVTLFIEKLQEIWDKLEIVNEETNEKVLEVGGNMIHSFYMTHIQIIQTIFNFLVYYVSKPTYIFQHLD